MNYEQYFSPATLKRIRAISAFVGLAIWLFIGYEFGWWAFILTFLFGSMVDLVNA